MKHSLLLFFFLLSSFAFGQISDKEKSESSDIIHLISQYSKARESMDTVLLDKILTEDIDQLVSSGNWRSGKEESVQGMLRSSTSNPGERKLTVEKIRFLSKDVALVDAKYEIINEEIVVRKMWSAFLVQKLEKEWKIAAIRNMLPSQ
ncbi:nuclear transport factor 2 family protein [Algoriphagus sediminis]|uniref:Nuclear transport factor 2 family protein n=1 Tax=Algoriphagus sediminis TaxID=3057113 RepID=A0ABT7YGA4_9BACT|nr:nuclear transport factor 2 family protein [Algoriphagus sediminis]MDN3205549.1 nuclear transport factor 2 family protein [Algoriphagus sediminis]